MDEHDITGLIVFLSFIIVVLTISLIAYFTDFRMQKREYEGDLMDHTRHAKRRWQVVIIDFKEYMHLLRIKNDAQGVIAEVDKRGTNLSHWEQRLKDALSEFEAYVADPIEDKKDAKD